MKLNGKRNQRIGEICVGRRATWALRHGRLRLGVRGLNRGLRVLLAFGFVVAAGCRQKMADQPRYEPLVGSTFFER